MKKKLLSLILVMVLVFSMAGTNAFACTVSSKNANYVAAQAVVAASNETIKVLVSVAQATPYNDVPALLVAVDSVVASTTRIVNALGFGVECEYVEYRIDGQRVLIDPLRVVTPIEP